jgi:hypothetical protein
MPAPRDSARASALAEALGTEKIRGDSERILGVELAVFQCFRKLPADLIVSEAFFVQSIGKSGHPEKLCLLGLAPANQNVGEQMFEFDKFRLPGKRLVISEMLRTEENSCRGWVIHLTRPISEADSDSRIDPVPVILCEP